MALVSLARVKRWLGIAETDATRDELLTDAIQGAQAILARLAGQPTFQEEDLDVLLDGNGKKTVYAPRSPITAIESIEFDIARTTGGIPISQLDSWEQLYTTGTPPALSDVRIDRAGGLTRLDRGLWPIGTGNIQLVATAGFTEESFPDDLRMLLVQTVALFFGRRGKEGVETVALSGFTTTFTVPEDDAILSLPGAKATIARYRRLAV